MFQHIFDFSPCRFKEKSFRNISNNGTQSRSKTRSTSKSVLTGLNLEFSFSKTGCQLTIKEPSLPYYLLRVGGRLVGFIHFPRVKGLYEMQTASFKIWTWVVISIFYVKKLDTTNSIIFVFSNSNDSSSH